MPVMYGTLRSIDDLSGVMIIAETRFKTSDNLMRQCVPYLGKYVKIEYKRNVRIFRAVKVSVLQEVKK